MGFLEAVEDLAGQSACRCPSDDRRAASEAGAGKQTRADL